MIDTRKRVGWFRSRVVPLAVLGLGTLAAMPVSMSGQRPSADTVEPLPSFSEPAISPDRSEIAVVSGGDIWTVPAAGGERRVVQGIRGWGAVTARRTAPVETGPTMVRL